MPTDHSDAIRDQTLSAVGFGLIATTEAAFAAKNGTTALYADALHGAADVVPALLGVAALKAQQSEKSVRRLRKWGLGIVCVGSALFGAHAVEQLVNNDATPTPAFVDAVVAYGAAAGNYAIARRLHRHHDHDFSGVTYDNHRHARDDAAASFLIGTAICVAHFTRLGDIDTLAAIAGSAYVALDNLPSRANSHD
jgi:Co/Zn/Cd efflux system component